MSPVEKYYENGRKYFEFKVDMWQMFRGCKHDNRICYQDYTKKGFHLILVKNPRWEMKINAITAEKTSSSYSGRGKWNIEDIFQ